MSNQFYNIRFPFTSKDKYKYFVDLDSDSQKAMKSDIMHVIFTPKGQKIRDPEFGTNLIKFIFNPNDDDSWSDVKNDIQEAVSKYVPNVKLTNIEVYEEQNNGLVAKIQYEVNEGAFVSQETIITNL